MQYMYRALKKLSQVSLRFGGCEGFLVKPCIGYCLLIHTKMSFLLDAFFKVLTEFNEQHTRILDIYVCLTRQGLGQGHGSYLPLQYCCVDTPWGLQIGRPQICLNFCTISSLLIPCFSSWGSWTRSFHRADILYKSS